MIEREIRLKLDRETKRLVCQLLEQHVNEWREKAHGQKTLSRLLIADQVERIDDVLEQIQAEWRQALPTFSALKGSPKPGGYGNDEGRH